MPNPADYYLQRKRRFLWMFDLIVRSVHSVLKKTFAGENIALLLTETRQEFGRLIPQLPYIGGKPLSLSFSFLPPCCWLSIVLVKLTAERWSKPVNWSMRSVVHL